MRTSPNKKRDRLILLSVGWVPFLELLQDADLYLARVAVLWYSPDDLHCHSFIRHGVNRPPRLFQMSPDQEAGQCDL